MYFMVFFEHDHVEIIHTLEHSAIRVPDEQLGEFIDMLLEAQGIINEGQRRKIDKERLTAWLGNGPKVFDSELVGLGQVTPIQKQSKALGHDGR